VTAPPNRLLDLDEAAEYLNVPKRWLGQAVRDNRVRCTRIGKHVRFTPEHIQEIIAAGEQAAASAFEGTKQRPAHQGRVRSKL
jgi:excisionase family DNA binding protein